MTIGGSLFLIAVGAILKFAITDDISGVDVQTIGVILMAVGVVGLLLGLLFLGRARRLPGEPIDPVDRRY
ncbi:MAG: DUF6458 family protein [Patulibacter minatonensis]